MKTIDYTRLQLESGHSLLDIGCGEGRHAISARLECNALAVGLDMHLHNLHTAAQRMQDCMETTPVPSCDADAGLLLINADAHQLPFADDNFDRIICAEVLEHILDYPQVVREAARVLKPGGILAVSVPTAWPERICWALDPTYAHAPGGHIRIFNHRHLRREIEQITGMSCYCCEGAHALHTPYWWLRCLFYRDPEGSRLVQAWHRLLVRDLFHQVRWTRWLEPLLNPFLGKSRILYFQ